MTIKKDDQIVKGHPFFTSKNCCLNDKLEKYNVT